MFKHKYKYLGVNFIILCHDCILVIHLPKKNMHIFIIVSWWYIAFTPKKNLQLYTASPFPNLSSSAITHVKFPVTSLTYASPIHLSTSPQHSGFPDTFQRHQRSGSWRFRWIRHAIRRESCDLRQARLRLISQCGWCFCLASEVEASELIEYPWRLCKLFWCCKSGWKFPLLFSILVGMLMVGYWAQPLTTWFFTDQEYVKIIWYRLSVIREEI